MPEDVELRENSEAVRAHLEISQNVIARMATNSASCKAWCIGLVSAILVLVADKGKPEFALIAVIPTAMFLALDVYYLALEKMFRNSYNSFIQKLHRGKISPEDVYVIRPTGEMFSAIKAACSSFAIWPFYVTLLIVIVIAQRLVLK